MNIKALFLCLFLAVLLILPTRVALAAENAIAVVIGAEGNGYVRRDGRDIPLELKDHLLLSDTVLTGADSKLQILFNDNSVITLGPDSLVELREFADAGTQSSFNAHLEQGALRVITGALTEANPEGFKMTTPLGTIGIRGTILNIETSDRHTIVRVLNTDKKVLVNGVNVAENFKIILNRGQDPIVSKMKPGEREKADNDFSIRTRGGGLKGIKSAPLEDISLSLPETGSLMTDLTEHPSDIFIPAPSPSPGPGPTIAGISGNLGMDSYSLSLFGINSFNGNFSCDINLQTGQVTNAAVSGSGTGTGSSSGSLAEITALNFAFTNGSGNINTTSYYIDNFSGTLSVSANNPLYNIGTTSNPADFAASQLVIDGLPSMFANIGDPTGPGSQFGIGYTDPTTGYTTVMYSTTVSGTRTQ